MEIDEVVDVAIVGGGIAGLAVAARLGQLQSACTSGTTAAPLKVRVYERDARVSARSQGYGMTLSNAN